MIPKQFYDRSIDWFSLIILISAVVVVVSIIIESFKKFDAEIYFDGDSSFQEFKVRVGE